MCTVKEQHQLLFRSMHSDIKKMQGGITAFSKAVGRDPRVVADAFNPANLDKAPSLAMFLDAIALCASESTVNIVLDGSGFLCFKDKPAESSDSEFVRYLTLVEKSSAMMANAAHSFSDGALSDRERIEMIQHLTEKINAANSLLVVLRGS